MLLRDPAQAHAMGPAPFKRRRRKPGAFPPPFRSGTLLEFLVDGAQVLLQLFAGVLRRVGVFHRIGVLVVVALRVV